MARWLSLAVPLSLALGCTGVVADNPSDPYDPTVDPVRAGLCDSAPTDPGTAMPFRRLTREEYDNTVRDLLGDETGPARALPADEEGLGFSLGATVSPLHVERYMSVAEEVASRAVSRLAEVHDCDPTERGAETCAQLFIEEIGARAYRRPLEDTQVERLFALYTIGAADGGHDDGIRLLLTGMLQSPYFLYRVELGGASPDGAADVVVLTPHERATRLSYLLWRSMPDDALFAAAEAGELDTPDGIAEQARRMLDDPRSKDAVRSFYLEWLDIDLDGLTKDPELYPQFDDALRASMQTEAETFIDYVIWERNGNLEELFTAPYAFVDQNLAGIYGLDPEGFGDELVRVDLDPTERAGLLTQPGLLAILSNTSESSPVHRGAFVRQRLLCQSLPPPPEDLVVVPPDPDPSLSTRERYQQHREDEACSGCHRLMDPIGFGFEHYDAIGRYRTEEENGQPVDATGAVHDAGDAEGDFYGAVELANQLAQSEEVRRCVTHQWFRFALGRLEGTTDRCDLEDVYTAFEASDFDVREILVALTKTDAFLYRRAAEGEEASR